LNTALALTRLGERVLVIDGDLGLANIDVLFGVTPAHSLQDVLTGDLAPEDAITEVRPGLGLLPAASGAEDLICLSRASARALADSLTPCLSGYGFVLLDLGAGIGGNVIELARLSRLRVVVTTPEPTALTDSYALIKVMHRSLGTRTFSYVVNNVMDPEETDFTRERLEGACGHFLGFTPGFLGAVRQDPGLPAAVMEQIPLLEASPESPASKDIMAIAENLFRQKKNILSGAGTPFLTEEECGNPSAED
ncbi:MAG: cellulose synthase operon protein YhjQ/BcsQ, partial [Desulfovibrio sp.]